MTKNQGLDWEKIREIICNAVDELQKILDDLPSGKVKNVLSIIINLLELICDSIP